MKKNSLRDRFFPESMRTLPNWILWKLETVNGHITKVPYSALYHGRASSTNPKTWTAFEDVARVFESSDEYNGIGFVFTEETGIVFIDIDHCIDEDGEVDSRYSDIVPKFENTFVDYSQSGTGVHIFAKGTVPNSFRNNKSNVEMYIGRQFVAMTGNAINEKDVSNCQSALSKVFKKYNSKKDKSLSFKRYSITQDERDIIRKARENESTGEEFRTLFDYGNWSQFSSHSEADIRLCGLLAFWCDRDVASIDNLFRQSALCRDKWIKRENYRNSTIETACKNCSECYSEFVARKRREELTSYDQFESEWRTFVRSKSDKH